MDGYTRQTTHTHANNSSFFPILLSHRLSCGCTCYFSSFLFITLFRLLQTRSKQRKIGLIYLPLAWSRLSSFIDINLGTYTYNQHIFPRLSSLLSRLSLLLSLFSSKIGWMYLIATLVGGWSNK
ncbi:hypothetical protein F4809DRAFT_595876 [Biscogniauxia mediterranea]|nr:hypothetical protein F4809DRAFT_595876 [Biscogniauxia mediterranea]